MTSINAQLISFSTPGHDVVVAAAGLEQNGQREKISLWLAGLPALARCCPQGYPQNPKPLSLLPGGSVEGGDGTLSPPDDLLSATCTTSI